MLLVLQLLLMHVMWMLWPHHLLLWLLLLLLLHSSHVNSTRGGKLVVDRVCSLEVLCAVWRRNRRVAHVMLLHSWLVVLLLLLLLLLRKQLLAVRKVHAAIHLYTHHRVRVSMLHLHHLHLQILRWRLLEVLLMLMQQVLLWYHLLLIGGRVQSWFCWLFLMMGLALARRGRLFSGAADFVPHL
jgi:hypothetical protein